MKTKYIQLYEEYTDKEHKGLDQHHSWQDVRNTIQSKLPFIIIDFKDPDSYKKCIEEELYDEKFAKQTYFYENVDADKMRAHSVFIFAGREGLNERVKGLQKRYNILRLIIGEYGKDVPQLYVEGEQVDLYNELFTSLTDDDMDGEDYYQMDSNFYKFIH